MRVWRLAKARYPALDGEGARLAGARWNSPGTPMVYTAGSLALAALELRAHIERSALVPRDLTAFEIDTPDALHADVLDADAELPDDWRTPDHPACRAAGDRWARRGDTAVLRVPSAIVPIESNYLINPQHPETGTIRVVARHAFAFDPRLF